MHISLRLPVGAITRVLLVCMAVLVVAGIMAVLLPHWLGEFPLDYTYTRLSDLDEEDSIPTWYSSLLLFLCAALFRLVGASERERNGHYARHWGGLAIIFVLLSVDEAVAFHEQATTPLRNALNAGGVLFFTWVVPGALLVLLLALIYRRFVLDLPSRTRARLLLAAGLYLGGALRMELLGAVLKTSQQGLLYELGTVVEETLEMAGSTALIATLLDHLARSVARDRAGSQVVQLHT